MTADAAAFAALNLDLASTPYIALRELGAGAMGAVFEVEHRALKRKLVLKVLRFPERQDHADRLRFEAQALSQLSHPNLLSVTDFGRTPTGRAYLVTERLHGKTMNDLIGDRGFLSIDEACLYCEQALAGLGFAHRAGVVHRDVKTENLFVCDGTDDGPPIIKVIDFGIAKVIEGGDDRPGVQVDPLDLPTADGMMVGTPTFMSPEQALAQKVDHRADIYGIGMVLYRLLAGRGPFLATDLLQIVNAIAHEVPKPPSYFAPEPIPRELDAIVLKALEKKPANRFQTAKEMLDSLKAARARWSSPKAQFGGTVPLKKEPVAIDRDAAPKRVTLIRGSGPIDGAVAPSIDRTERGTERLEIARHSPTAPLASSPKAFTEAAFTEAGVDRPIRPSRAITAEALRPVPVRTRPRKAGFSKWVLFVVALTLVGALTFAVFRWLGLA